MSRAVFLDRDGTLIRDVGYLRSADQLALLPGVPHALKRLHDAGYLLVLVTNQSGVARGLFTEEDVRHTNQALQELLRKKGIELDALYYCPHLPEGTVTPYAQVCDCRKPAPGMLLRAAREHDVDLARSFMIGDSPSDVEAGRRAGCRTIQLPAPDTDAGRLASSCRPAAQPDLSAASISEAVDLILNADFILK